LISTEFLKELKEYLFILSNEEKIQNLFGYYEILKNADIETLFPELRKSKEVFFDYKKDDTGGYTQGTISFMCGQPIVVYQIILLEDFRYGEFCNCKENDEGYNKEHQCCGQACDFFAPSIKIEKIVNIAELSWEGTRAKELWEIEEKYKKESIDYLLNYYHQQLELIQFLKQDEEELKEQIRKLQKQKVEE